MDLCADENFPGDAVQILRARGHDVSWMAEHKPKTADELAALEPGARLPGGVSQMSPSIPAAPRPRTLNS